jgi:hypothetical protein
VQKFEQKKLKKEGMKNTQISGRIFIRFSSKRFLLPFIKVKKISKASYLSAGLAEKSWHELATLIRYPGPFKPGLRIWIRIVLEG